MAGTYFVNISSRVSAEIRDLMEPQLACGFGSQRSGSKSCMSLKGFSTTHSLMMECRSKERCRGSGRESLSQEASLEGLFTNEV